MRLYARVVGEAAPFSSYSLPSYIDMISVCAAVPFASTLSCTARLMPLGIDSIREVELFGGGPGSYLDFTTLSRQVPTAGSADCAVTTDTQAVTTRPITTPTVST